MLSRSIVKSPVLVLCLFFWCVGIDAARGDEPEPEAVYNYIRMEVTVKGNSMRIKRSVRLTVNNARGDDFATIGTYETSYRKLKKLKAKVFEKFGNEIFNRSKKEFLKTCGYGTFELYQDICYYTTDMGAGRYPFVIEYEFEAEVKTLFGWPGLELLEDIPIEWAEYKLTIDNNQAFRYKVYGMDLEPTVESSKDKTTYLWTVRNISAGKKIAYRPASYTRPHRLEFVPEHFEFDGYILDGYEWKDVGQWYYELARDRYLPHAQLVDRRADIDDLALARNVYDSVIQSTRYVAVAIGIGGWQPHTASHTQAKGYGDCKDLTTLLISELQNRGLTAYPCLILTKSSGKTDPDFPNLRFNHLITMALIDGDTVWMDPTCTECPMGDLSHGVENTLALVIDSIGGQLCKTPLSTSMENRMSRTFEIQVAKNLEVSIKARLELTGNQAIYLRRRLPGMNKEETCSFLRGQFPDAKMKFEISQFELENLDDPNVPLVVKFRAKCSKKADMVQGVVYISPLIFSGLRGFEKAVLDERKAPLNLLYPETINDNFVIRWDPGLAVDSVVLPSSEACSTSFGQLTFSATNTDSLVTLNFTKSYFDYVLVSTQFEEFDSFRSRMKEINSRYVKLILDK